MFVQNKFYISFSRDRLWEGFQSLQLSSKDAHKSLDIGVVSKSDPDDLQSSSK